MFQLRLALALTFALGSFLIAETPSLALLGPKTWSATPGIEAQWLFPATGPARVMWMFMARPGRLEMRVWARDLDSWQATDQSGLPDPDPLRVAYEQDTLTYTWVAGRGTIEGSGPSVAYVAKDKNTGGNLTPGADSVTVTIDDVASLPPGDGGTRNDSPPFESQLSIVVDNPGGPFRIERILASGTTGAPATSGYNQQSDPSQRAYANFSIGFLTLIRATTDFGTGTGYGTVSLLVPPDETHEMHTVTVRLPPNGTPLDEKQANFGLYFHHTDPNFDEVPPSVPNEPNWYRNWGAIIPFWPVEYKHQIAAEWPEVDPQHPAAGTPSIGYMDWWGQYSTEGGAEGYTYIGEQDPECLFFESQMDTPWSNSDLWYVDINQNGQPEADERDVITYWGIDLAGATRRHELEHNRFWLELMNWEGFGEDYTWFYDDQHVKHWWPFYAEHGRDLDGDGIWNLYEVSHYPYDHYDALSLIKAHSGLQNPPPDHANYYDGEVEADWSPGRRTWQKRTLVGQDWSDRGAQPDRY